MAAAKSFLEKQIKMRLRLSLYSYLLMWEIFRLAHHHRSKSNLKNKIIFVLLYLSSSDGDRRRAVRDPGCSTCTPDLHSPEPSRHHVALCISMNFYILAIKPLIWSGMMFCVWLESMHHPSKIKMPLGGKFSFVETSSWAWETCLQPGAALISSVTTML